MGIALILNMCLEKSDTNNPTENNGQWGGNTRFIHRHIYNIDLPSFKMVEMINIKHKSSPAGVAQWIWAPACEPRGCQFNSLLGHMPEFWVRFPVGGMQEAINWCFSPFLSPSLPFSLKIDTIFIKKINLPWLVWPNGSSTGLKTKGLPVRSPVRAHAWVAGQVPSWGHARGDYTLMFLSLSFSLPSPLSKNK